MSGQSRDPRPGDWVVVVRPDPHPILADYVRAGSIRRLSVPGPDQGRPDRDSPLEGAWVELSPTDDVDGAGDAGCAWWVEEVRPVTPAELAAYQLDQESAL